MRSPTFIKTGEIKEYGSARNPAKWRHFLPTLHDRLDPNVLARAAEAKRPSFQDKHALARALRDAGIPVTTRAMETERVRGKYGNFTVYTMLKGERLRGLKSKLHGTLSVDPLVNGVVYAVRIVFPTVHPKRPGDLAEQIHSLTRRINAYAHLRVILGDSVLPINFAGLYPALGAYVVVSMFPEKLLRVSRNDRGATPLFHQMVDEGVYPEKHRDVVRKAETGEYRVFDPLSLMELPEGIFRAFKKLRQTSDPAQAWISSGGASWSDEHGSTFELHSLNGYTHPTPVTIASTMDSHLAKAMRHPETGAVTARPVNPGIQQRLDALMKAGTLIGQGVYGKVFSIQLTKQNQADLITISASLSNSLSFRSLPRAGGKVVLKVERLSTLMPLGKRKVMELAGEAYIQQYVHDNAGLPVEVQKRVPSVAPGVYFSGTVANAYHLICMDHVEGTSLWSAVKRGIVSDQVYNAMVRAVSTMLRNGVVHSDLHVMNVVLVKSGNGLRAQVIDFGFASIVPPSMKRSIIKTLNETGSIDSAFRKTGLLNTVNAVKKNYTYYHSNAKLIAELKRLRNIGPKTGIRSHPAQDVKKTARTSKTTKLAKTTKLENTPYENWGTPTDEISFPSHMNFSQYMKTTKLAKTKAPTKTKAPSKTKARNSPMYPSFPPFPSLTPMNVSYVTARDPRLSTPMGRSRSGSSGSADTAGPVAKKSRS